MQILKSNLFWSILQTLVAIFGFYIICYEMRLSRIRDENIKSKYKIKIHYIANYAI